MLKTSLKTSLSTSMCLAVVLGLFLGSARGDASNVLGYDPKADPFEQYHESLARAEQENKLLLVIAGGDWCSWCHVLERFVVNDAQIAQRLDDTFVVMKVYVGFDNYNDAFFSQLPEARGAPHFWIISPQKEVLASQTTGVFESVRKKGYDKKSFLSFLQHWKDRSSAAPAKQVARGAAAQAGEVGG